jgi:ABC-type phosphate transport system permease subunit
MEYNYQLSEKGIDPEQLGTLSKTIMILTFGVAISIILSVYYLLFHFFFKRLYGRHLNQLQATLSELDEAIQ